MNESPLDLDLGLESDRRLTELALNSESGLFWSHDAVVAEARIAGPAIGYLHRP